MRCLILPISIFLIAVLLGATSLADRSTTAQAVLHLQIDIETPKSSSSSAATIISPLDEGETHEFDFHGYNFQILITDYRLNEFTVQLSLTDDDGSIVDSTNLIVGLNRDATFNFAFDKDSVSGQVRVSQIIGSTEK